ncbi:MAG: hypothetical protein AAF902_02610 [Chloroflexota bacterium]
MFDDAFEVLWQLEWMPKAIFIEQTNPFFTEKVFFPMGWHLPSAAQPSWYFLLLAPVSNWLGSTLTYNLLHLFLLLLIALGVYFFVFDLSEDSLAAVISGLIFATTANLQMRLAGHTHTLFAVCFLTWCYYACFKGLQEQESNSIKWAVCFGVLLALCMVSHWYFIFIAPLPILAIVFFPNSLMDQSLISRAKFMLLGLAVALIVITPFVLAAWYAQREMFGETVASILSHSDPTGIGLDALFRPQWQHPLWRDQISDARPNETIVATLGYTSLILVCLSAGLRQWKETRVLWVVGFIALIFSMGTSLQWAGQRVEIRSSSAMLLWLNNLLLLDLVVEPNRIAIPLPGAVFYQYVPFFDSIRVFSRFVLPLIWSLAVLSGLAVAGIRRRYSGSRFTNLVVPVLLGLIIFEGWMTPYLNFTEVKINQRPEVNAWLDTIPNEAALMEFPRYIDKIALYNQAFHGHPIVNGYMSHTPAYLVEQGSPFMDPWPTQEAVDILRSWEVTYMFVSNSQSEAFLRDVLPTIERINGICFVKSFDQASMGFKQTIVYEIVSTGSECAE